MYLVVTRAAAELSNRDRIMRQNSSSEGHVSRNEGRENYETSKLASKPFPEDSASKPFLEETEPQREQIDKGRPYNEKTSGSFKDSRGNTKEYVQSTSLKSKASKDNDTEDHDVLAAGAHSRKKSLKVSRGEMSMKKHSFMYEAENTNDWSEKSQNFREERIGKQSSVNFSRSGSSTSDDVNIFADSDDQKFGHVAVEDSFVDIGMKKQSIKYDSEDANDWPEKSKHFMEERNVKLPSVNCSSAHSIISDGENIFVNSKDQTFGHEVDEDPFVGISKGSIPGEASLINTHETAAVVFDKSDSESDGGYDFGTTYDEQKSVFHFPSKLPENSSVNSDSWSPISGSTKILQPNTPSLFSIRKNSSPDHSENLVAKDGSEMDNNMTVKFDYSDGPSSESDDGMNTLGYTLKPSSRDISSAQNSSSHSVRSEIKDKSRESLGSPLREKGYSGFGKKQPSLSSDDELMFEEIFKGRDQGKTASPELSFRKSSAGKKKEYSGFGRRQSSLLSDDELMSEEILQKSSQGKSNPPGKLSFRKSSSGKPAPRSAESQIESIEYGNESNSDSGEGLNFGKFTGGFRHKGYDQPSYLKNRLGGRSLLKKETEDAATSNVSSISPPAVESPMINEMFGDKKGTKISVLSSDSDSDSSEEEEYIQKSSGQRIGRVTPNAAEEVNKKSSLGASRANYDFSNNDLDDDAPEESLARKNHLRSGISRRTKAPSSSAKPNSFPNTRWNESETPDSDATGHRQSRVSDASENQQESESQRKNSQKRPTSANVPNKPAKSNFWAPPEQPSSAKAAHGTLHESKTRLKFEALDGDGSNDRKPVKTQRKKSEMLDSDEEDEKRSTRTNTSETPRELESERKSSMKWENAERPTSTKVASKPAKSSVFSPPKQYKVASKPSHPSFSGTPEQPNSAKPTNSTTTEPRTSLKSSASKQPSSPQTKAETSVSNENLKAATLNKTNSNKASHVHPKLPDYDSLVQAFRKNRP